MLTANLKVLQTNQLPIKIMNRFENFKIGLIELSSNKLRTSLTMLGIVFGVASVIAMLSIGEGARQETLEQIELLGTNNIIISKINVEQNATEKSRTSFSPGLSIKDAHSISEINPLVEYVTVLRSMEKRTVYKSKILKVKIIGTSTSYPLIYNSQLSEGKFFKEHHLKNYSNVCIIGSGIKSSFFGFEEALNKEIKIGGSWFRIIGVISPKNISKSRDLNLGIDDFNMEVYVPFTTMIHKMGETKDGNNNLVITYGQESSVKTIDRSSVDGLTIKIKKGTSIIHAAEIISRILKRKHYNVKDYKIVIPEEMLAQKQKTQIIFNVVMGAIAGISLLVGGIGIMNIMLSNILERTKEIGIRRAMGATKQNILSQFMYEAIIISILGGIVGVVIGFVLTSLITGYADWRTSITPFSVVLAFTVSVCVGLLFGIYPAKRAAEKDPIESLRYE